MQEAEGIISIAMDFVGDQNGLEATLADIQVMEFTYCNAVVVPYTNEKVLVFYSTYSVYYSILQYMFSTSQYTTVHIQYITVFYSTCSVTTNLMHS